MSISSVFRIFHLSIHIRSDLRYFYRATIESVLTYGYPLFCNTSKQDLETLNRIHRKASRICGVNFPALKDVLDNIFYNKCRKLSRCPGNLRYIMSSVNQYIHDTRHPELYSRPYIRTEIYYKSFVPSCIRILNEGKYGE